MLDHPGSMSMALLEALKAYDIPCHFGEVTVNTIIDEIDNPNTFIACLVRKFTSCFQPSPEKVVISSVSAHHRVLDDGKIQLYWKVLYHMVYHED